MPDLEAELARLNYDLEEEMIVVVPLVDYPNLRFDGMHFNLLKDREIEIPLWIAEVLEEQGIVMIPRQKSPTFNILRTIARKEKNQPTLTDLDSLIFRRVNLERQKLEKEGTAMALRRLTSIEGSLNTILRIRARKIMEMVRDDEGGRELGKMTPEEEWLFTRVNAIYTAWKHKIGMMTEMEDL